MPGPGGSASTSMRKRRPPPGRRRRPTFREINVALLGAGAQGQVLTDAMLRIPGLRFRAVCDVWKEYNQKAGRQPAQEVQVRSQRLRRLPRDARQGEGARRGRDCHARLLARQHAVACLKAGLHVYCEKEMSNTLEGARQHGRGRPGDRASSSRSAISGGATRATATAMRRCIERTKCSAGSPPSTASGTGPRRLRGPRWPREGTQSRRPRSSSTASTPCSSSATGGGTRAWAAARSSTSARTRSTSTAGSSSASPSRDGQRRATTTTRRRTSGTTTSWRSTNTTRRRARSRPLPDPDDQQQPGLLREVHGR